MDEYNTLLKTEHKTEIIMGIMEANSTTGIYGENMNAPKGHVEINGVRYKTNLENAESFLGFYVTAYVKETNSSEYGEIICIYADGSRNSFSEINSYNIEPSTDKYEFTYYNDREGDSRTSRLMLDKNAPVIYNEKYLGRLYTGLIGPAELNPECGSIFLLDNNGDNIIDILFITAYDAYLIRTISEYERRIFSKNGETLDLSWYDVIWFVVTHFCRRESAR